MNRQKSIRKISRDLYFWGGLSSIFSFFYTALQSTVGFTRQAGLQRAFLSTAFHNNVAYFEFEPLLPGRVITGLRADIPTLNSIKTCPQDGLKELFSMGAHRIQLTGLAFRFRHFGAAFACVREN